MRETKTKKTKLKKTFQIRGIELKGEEKSSGIRELMYFGMEQRSSIYSTQKEKKN